MSFVVTFPCLYIMYLDIHHPHYPLIPLPLLLILFLFPYVDPVSVYSVLKVAFSHFSASIGRILIGSSSAGWVRTTSRLFSEVCECYSSLAFAHLRMSLCCSLMTFQSEHTVTPAYCPPPSSKLHRSEVHTQLILQFLPEVAICM